MLQIKNAALAYENNLVFSHLDLHLKVGEFACISGASGCGKSSLLNAILGFIPLKEGGINVNGVELNNITIHQIRKLIAWIPQELALPMEWVRDMVQLPFTLKANRATSFNESVLFAKFEELGLENELYDKRVNEISGGQRQRMMIAVASMLNKSLILADEPTSALDVESSIMVRNFFLRQAQKGCAILAISHDANFSCGCHKRLIMGDTQSIILRDNM